MSALAPSSRYPSFKFASPGDKIKGVISQPPEDSLVMKFGITPRVPVDPWPDGTPRMQTRIILRTSDGTDWAIYAKGMLAPAIRDALVEAGAPDVEMGDLLEVEFTGYGKPKAGGQPPKLYAAKYVAVASAIGDDEPPF